MARCQNHIIKIPTRLRQGKECTKSSNPHFDNSHGNLHFHLEQCILKHERPTKRRIHCCCSSALCNCCQIPQNVKNAHDSLQQPGAEIVAAAGLLSALEVLSARGQPWLANVQSLSRPGEPLILFHSALERLG